MFAEFEEARCFLAGEMGLLKWVLKLDWGKSPGWGGPL